MVIRVANHTYKFPRCLSVFDRHLVASRSDLTVPALVYSFIQPTTMVVRALALVAASRCRISSRGKSRYYKTNFTTNAIVLATAA